MQTGSVARLYKRRGKEQKERKIGREKSDCERGGSEREWEMVYVRGRGQKGGEKESMQTHTHQQYSPLSAKPLLPFFF